MIACGVPSATIAAMHAGARADVDHVIGAADGFLVVFDDDHRIADVPELFESLQQALVVALMQADRRFVEHVHHAGQPGTDLRRQADALCFAAGERFCRAVERQVVEADVDQELQAIADFLEHLLGDLRLVAGKFQRQKIVACILQWLTTDFVQGTCMVFAADAYVACFFAQTAALAGRAGLIADQSRQILANGERVGFLVAAFEVNHDAFKSMLAQGHLTTFVDIVERHLLAPGTIKQICWTFSGSSLNGVSIAKA
jgi:hypothetical protein